MKKLIFKTFILLSIIFLNSCNSINNCDEIHELMKEQEKSWNMGNIDNFMEKYWDNDSLIFIGKSGINYGWKKTISNYKKSYRNKNEMGELKFKNIICNPLNDSTHIITGKWSLTRNDSIGNINGYYTLLWIKKLNGWKIIYDHTS
ncbi:MAG: DUF4440 domain-containing protein [Crocinitomicaceae bacterium]|nr:DUF4440 domain-containing protein [Crocinitomicaceae bacterium]|tara:strand:+ start:314 stop:751 length:438 start_codon:yes stop_codon:yes gene_type:complete